MEKTTPQEVVFNHVCTTFHDLHCECLPVPVLHDKYSTSYYTTDTTRQKQRRAGICSMRRQVLFQVWRPGRHTGVQ
eukprot:scaffold83036_cov39-Attheya_sp.AAC.2